MSSTTGNKLRWGFLSTAHIGRKNWKAIRNSGNGTLVAIASRSLSKAQTFISECQAAAPFDPPPRAIGSYEELLASPDVEAVYIPLPTGVRKEWVVRAARAGKHVVCEKPCAVSPTDLEEMLEACCSNGVQFIDGVMFMHSQRLECIRRILNDKNTVGTVRRVTSAFSFCAPNDFFDANIRANGALEPHGCLGDLGWYCIRFALWTLEWRMPTRVTGRILSQANAHGDSAPVPTEFSGELFFANGASSGFYCSFLTHNEQRARISGSKGSLDVSDFVMPFFGAELVFRVNNAELVVAGCDFNMEAREQDVSVPEYSNSHPTSQETNLFRSFAAQVQSRELNSNWAEMALKTQRVMAACYESALGGGHEVAVR